ncbi:MAG: hypothetical protein JST90_04195 [Bacteroidetes bacterium]|nr:hypothetical protein [Bacteroidota bacterium]
MTDKNFEESIVSFTLPELVDQSFIDELFAEVGALPFSINVNRKKPDGPFMMMEWAVPTMMVAYIAKPFFESFLKEAGKDSYEVFKVWLKKILAMSRRFKLKTITATESIHKISPNYSQSKVISIVIRLSDDRNLKVLFNDNLSQEDWELALDSLLDFVVSNYENIAPLQESDESDSYMRMLRRQPLYAIMDIESNKWVFYNDLDLARIQMEFDKNK